MFFSGGFAQQKLLNFFIATWHKFRWHKLFCKSITFTHMTSLSVNFLHTLIIWILLSEYFWQKFFFPSKSFWFTAHFIHTHKKKIFFLKPTNLQYFFVQNYDKKNRFSLLNPYLCKVLTPPSHYFINSYKPVKPQK